MPKVDGKYVSPIWHNNAPPALDAAELQAMTDTLAAAFAGDDALSAATRALYGMPNTAVPDDVLAFLGKYNQYWWGKRLTTYIAVLGVSSSAYILKDVSSTSTIKSVPYSASITILSDGTVSLENPSTLSISYSTYTDAQTLYGNYFQGSDGKIYYCADGATVSRSYSSTEEYKVSFSDGCSPVFAELTYGNFEYLQSSDRNAYPDSGITDGYEYQYLGIPFENATKALKIETGSYVGTGIYGENTPNEIVFNSPPYIVFVTEGYGTRSTKYAYAYILFPKFGAGTSTRGASYDGLKVTLTTDNIVSWYSETSSLYQANSEGITYCYYAICQGGPL